MRSAMEWAQVRASAADGVTKSEIARRLGMNRRTVARYIEADEPPRYERVPSGSMLDPLEPVLRQLFEDWPEIKAPRVTEILRADYRYGGAVDQEAAGAAAAEQGEPGWVRRRPRSRDDLSWRKSRIR